MPDNAGAAPGEERLQLPRPPDHRVQGGGAPRAPGQHTRRAAIPPGVLLLPDYYKRLIGQPLIIKLILTELEK